MIFNFSFSYRSLCNQQDASCIVTSIIKFLFQTCLIQNNIKDCQWLINRMHLQPIVYLPKLSTTQWHSRQNTHRVPTRIQRYALILSTTQHYICDLSFYLLQIQFLWFICFMCYDIILNSSKCEIQQTPTVDWYVIWMRITSLKENK